MDGIWIQIEDTAYSVSNSGQIRNDRTGRILKETLNPKGYCTVHLHCNGVASTRRTHRLVAEAFVLRPENSEGLLVDHIDNDRLNNKASNLQWMTSGANTRKARSVGAWPTVVGEDHQGSTLKSTEVLQIIELLLEGFSYSEIGKHFSVDNRTISSIAKRETWSHLTEAFSTKLAKVVEDRLAICNNQFTK